MTSLLYLFIKLILNNKTFCGFSMGRNQYWAGRVYDLCVYYMTGTPEGSTESGFMEKPGIEPATPGLQGIALIHYTTGNNKTFCGRVPWLYQYWPGGSMLFVVLCPGTPEGSTGSGSGFKASQKTGQRLKVSSDRLGEAGNRTCDPWFTRHRFIPYTTAASRIIKVLLPKISIEYRQLSTFILY